MTVWVFLKPFIMKLQWLTSGRYDCTNDQMMFDLIDDIEFRV